MRPSRLRRRTHPPRRRRPSTNGFAVGVRPLRHPPPSARAKLAQAKARLDTLDWYPRPVRMRRVRLVSAPWAFRLPWLRRFHGYTMWDLILVRMPVDEAGDDLVTHELCHVWQMQHHPVAMPLSYLYRGYRDNPHEIEARRAEQTTAAGRDPVGRSSAVG